LNFPGLKSPGVLGGMEGLEGGMEGKLGEIDGIFFHYLVNL
jgi:hypothetical protein